MNKSNATLLLTGPAASYVLCTYLTPSFSDESLGFQIGAMMPIAAVILIPSAIIGLITRVISQDHHKAAFASWATFLAIVAILSIGVFQVTRITGGQAF